jgi:hypothetical protein
MLALQSKPAAMRLLLSLTNFGLCKYKHYVDAVSYLTYLGALSAHKLPSATINKMGFIILNGIDLCLKEAMTMSTHYSSL